MAAADRILQTIVQEKIKNFAMPHAVTVSRLFEQIRGEGHILHTSGNNERGMAEGQRIGTKHHRLQSAAADFIDRHRRGPVSKAGKAHCLAGRSLATAAGKDLADNDFIDSFCRDAILYQQTAYDRSRQLHGRNFSKAAAKTAKGSA